jgi:hypothetical protein
MKENLAIHQINLGVNPCNLLKRMYFAETPWIDCYKQVAAKFTQLKQSIRTQAPKLCEIEVLQLINKFAEEDMKDYLN